MQSTFGAIFLALVDGVPKVMGLREMLLHFIDHRHEVVVRRSEFDLGKALDREHILEGLQIAVDNIDEVIKVIRGSHDTDIASAQLQERFELSERQAKAILDMRLARLTGLEMEKLETELAEVRVTIEDLRDILGSRERRMSILTDELQEVSDAFGDDRRTAIVGESSDLDVEDLIVEEDMVITVSRQGYVKRMSVDTYRAQRRGGRGLRGMHTKDQDWVEHLFVASTHDTLMVFTREGRCHWLKVWQIPQASRQSRGKPFVNLLNLAPEEDIAAVVPVREFADDRYLLFATRKGKVKKTALSAYSNIRQVGLIGINIREGDELIDVQITEGDSEIILASRNGMAIRFLEGDARPMGRAAGGVRGIRLRKGDVVVGMVVVRPESTLLVATENGMGKRSEVDEYRLQQRGGQGVINVRVNDKTGKVVSIKAVREDEQLMVITRNGVVNRQLVGGIKVIGRATQGVRLVNLDEGDTIVDVARVIADENGEDDEQDGLEQGESAEAEEGEGAEAEGGEEADSEEVERELEP